MLQFEQQYVEALPSAGMYEKSYMHRDTVTQVVVSNGRDMAWLVVGALASTLQPTQSKLWGSQIDPQHQCRANTLVHSAQAASQFAAVAIV